MERRGIFSSPEMWAGGTSLHFVIQPYLMKQTFFDGVRYGDRIHKNREDIDKLLSRLINSAFEAEVNIGITSFAIERAQEVLYHLNNLLIEDCIPRLMVFMDTPMAIGVSEVFEHHPKLFDEEMMELIRSRESPFDFSGLKITRTADESKGINHIKETVVIIAGSGMCTG